METDVNKVDTPVEQPVATEAPVMETPSAPVQELPKRKSKALGTVLIALLVLLLLGAAVYAGYYFGGFDGFGGGDESGEDFSGDGGSGFEDQEEADAVPIYSDYLGAYIDAELPEGWEIIEYEDGEGSDMLMDAEYQGLTGLSIVTDEDEEVFQVFAIMGIGGIDICDTVAKFTDTPQSYIEEINDLTTEYNTSVENPEPMPVVNQIGDTEYTEVSFIDYRGRRVGNKIYWNDLDNVNLSEFHPLCGLPAGALSFDTLTFEYTSSGMADTGSSYGVRIIGDPSEATLLTLDYVVSSIVLK